ncbi:MAG: N-6 DNA methylase [Fimbriimonadales bacterium]|nr:N-6 DNA methylase [Fimbriimonadales bacterium]
MEQVRALLKKYLADLGNQLDQGHGTPELSLRNPLHNLLSGMAALHSSELHVTGEPTKEVYGQPDFIITTGLLPVGHVEAESIDKDLRKLTGSAKEQNDRFQKDLDNFLQTDHLEFRLFQFGKEVAAIQLQDPRTDKPRVTMHIAEQFKELLAVFFDFEAPPATSTEQIAEVLAKRAHFLRAAAENLLAQPGNILRSYLEAFRQTLYEELDEARFADVYAQTFTYGLFLSWLEHPTAVKDPLKAIDNIPKALPPVRVLLKLGGGDDLPEELRWIVDAICRDLSQCDPADALKAFHGSKDPLVHFYEHFLAKYDPALRESRGVYYTPDEVVSFIVRSVDEIARDTFGKAEGIADNSVLLLDPAVGTATFLAHCYRKVKETLTERGDGGYWPDVVHDHILEHFYGFEIMPSAYTLAHLKCRFLLEESGVELADDKRLPIYLTNTLEPGRTPNLALPGMLELSQETEAATRVKNEEPIIIVLGNPPYSGQSMNPSKDAKGNLTAIGQLIQTYFEVDGEPLGEANPKWLHDDYVKFIRFAQDRIAEKTGHGVVAMITNHGYLDNPTFRGMRRSLMLAFHELYFLDLHGNSLKKEKAPDGSPDKNVFDIMQGVAICILIRKDGPVPGEGGKVYHADLFGSRKSKYEVLQTRTYRDITWQELTPSKDFYLFVPQDETLREEYSQGWKVTDIFPVHSVGIVTARDSLCIAWSKDDMWSRVNDFVSMAPEDARHEYDLGKDARDWRVGWAQSDAKNSGPEIGKVKPILYRPFDRRYTYYTGNSRGFLCYTRHNVMQHMFDPESIGLVISRGVETGAGFEHAWVSRLPITHHTLSVKEVNYLLPLWVFATGSDSKLAFGQAPNLELDFLVVLARELALPVADVAPNDVLAYIYSILYAPSYRSRYAEFLRADFPRIPLPQSKDAFFLAAKVGTKLIRLHLLEDQSLDSPGVDFPTPGPNVVEKFQDRYVEPTGGEPGRVKLNAAQSFVNVPPEVWEYRIGGYQPAKKWLNDRVGRKLTQDDITHYRRMLAAIRETIVLLPACDEIFMDCLKKECGSG